MESNSLRCFAAFLILSIAGCGSAGEGRTFDNTGGAPPPGNPIGFESVSVALDTLNASCTSQLGSVRFAVLARAEADIPVIDGNAGCTTSLRTALAAAFAALTADQAVGIFTLSLGGCVRSYEVARVTRDGPVIRPWVLLRDTTLGASSPQACTTDVILGVYALRFDGATGANAMELLLGTVNPNYPRNPAVPVF